MEFFEYHSVYKGNIILLSTLIGLRQLSVGDILNPNLVYITWEYSDANALSFFYRKKYLDTYNI